MTGPAPTLRLTPRALLSGLGVGALLTVANVYMGLKVGWSESGNLTAVLLTFALVRPLTRRAAQGFSPEENQLAQAVATAAATAPSTSGVVASLAAMALGGAAPSVWAVTAWGVALGALGLWVALPLRERLLVRQGLAFPSGRATSELITAIHGAADSGLAKARVLLLSALPAAAFVWFRDGRPQKIPAVTSLPGTVFGQSAESLTLGFAWSPMLLGIGSLVGPRVGLSVLAGSLIAWIGIAPSAGLETAGFSGARIWPGVALMAAASLTALLREVGPWRRPAPSASEGEGVPSLGRGYWAVWCACAVGVAWAGSVAFGLSLPLIAASVALAVAGAGVCARATGQTDIAPYGVLTQLSQLVLAPLCGGSAAVNLASSSVVGGTAVQASCALWSFRAGHDLGVPVRSQTAAFAWGTLFGAGVTAAVNAAFVRAGLIGGDRLPAPSAHAYRAVADWVTGGGAALAPGLGGVLALAVIGGTVLTWGERWPFAPSAVAMGVGFLIPASYATALCAGALLAVAARRTLGAEADARLPSVAAGVITGEAVAGVAAVTLAALMPAST